jgi:hypothetical protein
MPWIIGFILLGLFAGYVDNHPAVIPFLWLAGFAFVGYIVLLFVTNSDAWGVWRRAKQYKRELRTAERNRKMAAWKLAIQKKLSRYAPPTPDEFRQEIESMYSALSRTLTLQKPHLEKILDAQRAIYASSGYDQKPPKEVKQPIELLCLAFAEGLDKYTRLVGPGIALPSLIADPDRDKRTSVFYVEKDLNDYIFDPEDKLCSQAKEAYAALARPFSHFDFQSVGLNQENYRPRFYEEVSEETKASYIEASGDAGKLNSAFKRLDQHKAVIDKKNAEVWKRHSEHQRIFINTPYWNCANELLPSIIVNEPFDIPDDARFRHQWIVGAPGAGKTTFISAMIARTLRKLPATKLPFL